MKKYIGLFVIAGMLMGAGVASADRGFWYNNNSGGWQTFFNVTNTHTASQTATVQFFDILGASLGSTTTTLAPNANWNFSTEGVGNITRTAFEAGTRGTVIISGTINGTIRGYASIFNSTGKSGFNLRLRTTTGAGDRDTTW